VTLHIMNEANRMKYLKIENSKGFYQLGDQNWIDIDQIGKDHLLQLLDKTIEGDFEMDDNNNQPIGNKAHQIIYKHLYNKLSEISSNRSRFRDESEQLYREAILKYGEALDSENA
jgi:hypothetical protein